MWANGQHVTTVLLLFMWLGGFLIWSRSRRRAVRESGRFTVAQQRGVSCLITLFWFLTLLVAGFTGLI